MKWYMVLVMMLVLAPAASALGAVDVTFLNQDPDPVEPGEYTELRFRVENVGNFDIDDLEIELEPEFPFEFDSYDDRVKVIPRLTTELEGKKAVTLKFRTRINENALTGDEEIRILVKFKDGSEKIEEEFISIQSRDILLQVENVNLNPDRPIPGQEANVEITVRNLEAVAAEDVTVKLGLQSDSQVAVIGTTNEKFLEELKGGESYTFNYSLLVGANAESRIYQIPVLIDYDDKFGNSYNFSSSFGCAVEAPPEYIVNIEKSDLVLPNTKGSVVLSVSNIGASDINYVSMEIEPSENLEVLSNRLVYLGNLESDDYETAEFDFYVNDETGNIPFNAVLKFKDSYNKNVEEKVPLSLRVYSKSDAAKFGLVEQGGGFGSLLFLLLLAGGGWYYYKNYHKKRK